VLLSRSQDGTFYVEDVRRGRWAPAQRDEVIFRTAEIDGYSVRIILEQEPGSAGKSVTDYLARRLAGYSVGFDRPTGTKETRAQPFASQCGISNVVLVAADWNQAYLDELSLFPNGRYDDQVDASCGAFNVLTRYPQQLVPPTFIRLHQVPPICHGVQLEPPAQRPVLCGRRRAESA